MRKRALPWIPIVAVLGLTVTPPAEASQRGRLCEARGAYRGQFIVPGFGNFAYMSKIDGTKHAGTGDVVFADLEPALLSFLGGTAVTPARGAWRRINRHAFALTFFQYVWDDTGVIWKVKYSVVHDFGEDCRDSQLNARGQVFPFDPNDPFTEGDPVFVIDGTAISEKIRVE